MLVAWGDGYAGMPGGCVWGTLLAMAGKHVKPWEHAKGESGSASDELAARFVASLRDLGCRVALDDFGAGHTSFRTLKALAVDMVKIDGSFVVGLTRQPSDVAFVRALTDLAVACGKATVAECIEDERTAGLVRDCGVDYFQGYHFGRPGPLAARPVPGAGNEPIVIA